MDNVFQGVAKAFIGSRIDIILDNLNFIANNDIHGIIIFRPYMPFEVIGVDIVAIATRIRGITPVTENGDIQANPVHGNVHGNETITKAKKPKTAVLSNIIKKEINDGLVGAQVRGIDIAENVSGF